MLIKAILVGLVLGLCKSEWIYGFPQVGRPIVVSTLTGLFLGDPVQGVIMGSVLELMFIGSFPIGAAVSPDYTSAGAICTAFAILTGAGKAVATAMALPIALLGGFIFIGCKLMNAAFGQIMLLLMRFCTRLKPIFRNDSPSLFSDSWTGDILRRYASTCAVVMKNRASSFSVGFSKYCVSISNSIVCTSNSAFVRCSSSISASLNQ